MEAILKYELDDFEIEYEVLPITDTEIDSRKCENNLQIENIDARLADIDEKIEKLNVDINKLTNHADGLDYTIAVASGVLTGLIDSFFVGETEIDQKKIQEMLEKKYHTANDSAYKHKDKDGHWTSSAMYHRLDDLAHHPTLAGLIASILVRYFRLVIFVDGSDGKSHVFFADTSSSDVLAKEKEELMKAWLGAVIGGICLWLANVAEKKYVEKNDEEMPEPLRKMVKFVCATPMVIEILKVADVWIGHMMSDVSTSQGIPGIFLSLLKEISALPGLKKTNLPVYVDSLYGKGELNLAEWGGVAFVAAKKQAMPVLINEALVRGFYFVRHLVMEYKNANGWKNLDWKKTIPFGNRTVERMMTISTGTLVAVDIADAAIRSATNPNSISAPTFVANMILRVNFVGIGRFAIAVATDVSMGVKLKKAHKERIAVTNEKINLLGAKTYYKVSNMWITAEETGISIEEAMESMKVAIIESANAIKDIDEAFITIDESLENIAKNDKEFAQELLDILEW